MTKLKLSGLAKSNTHFYLSLIKVQEFLPQFVSFLKKIGIGTYEFGHPEYKEGCGREYDQTKWNDIKTYVDEHVSFFTKNQSIKIDLIFGKNKIFIIINTKKNKQKDISAKIKKFFYL